ncbi:MAG: alanine racemase [Ignavibacteria bacterium]
MRPTLARINCSNLKYNYLNIRKKVKNSRIMAVVKADAYGHGMIKCVEALNSLGSRQPDYYAVSILEEAVELRKSKVASQPVLVFDPVGYEEAEYFKEYDIIPTVFEEAHLGYLRRIPSKGGKLKVHVKIDTGMGRVGVRFDEAYNFIKKIHDSREFIIDGIYTHFATSDESDKSYAFLQLSRFNDIIERLKSDRINYGLAHASNSGAILDMPETYLDMTRPGIVLYGYYPSLETSESVRLKPVMSVVTKVTNVNLIDKGQSVSYGRRFIAQGKTEIASVPVGYADGYVRALSNKIFAIIKGKLCPQVGQICMDRIMFDITGLKVKANDEVILLGKKNKLKIDAWDWSRALNTIPYEITCGISKRVPRIYM